MSTGLENRYTSFLERPGVFWSAGAATISVFTVVERRGVFWTGMANGMANCPMAYFRPAAGSLPEPGFFQSSPGPGRASSLMEILIC